MAHKTKILWAIISPFEGVMTHTLCDSRRGAIRRFLPATQGLWKEEELPERWAYFRKAKFKAGKVRLHEVRGSRKR